MGDNQQRRGGQAIAPIPDRDVKIAELKALCELEEVSVAENELEQVLREVHKAKGGDHFVPDDGAELDRILIKIRNQSVSSLGIPEFQADEQDNISKCAKDLRDGIATNEKANKLEEYISAIFLRIPPDEITKMAKIMSYAGYDPMRVYLQVITKLDLSQKSDLAILGDLMIYVLSRGTRPSFTDRSLAAPVRVRIREICAKLSINPKKSVITPDTLTFARVFMCFPVIAADLLISNPSLVRDVPGYTGTLPKCLQFTAAAQIIPIKCAGLEVWIKWAEDFSKMIRGGKPESPVGLSRRLAYQASRNSRFTDPEKIAKLNDLLTRAKVDKAEIDAFIHEV